MKKIIFASALAFAATAGAAAAQDVEQSSIIRGGKLYDRWYTVVKAPKPEKSHALYPSSNEKYANKPGSNWRCKECHGWDGRGADGAYATGSHATGIKGINGMIGGNTQDVIAVLTAPEHGYGDHLSDEDLTDLANFVVYGQPDWDAMVDYDPRAARGDAERGKPVFQTLCVACHGSDGMLPKDMPPLGSLSDNPWEMVHKVLHGQPGEAMPALNALDHQITADIVAYMATLPAQ